MGTYIALIYFDVLCVLHWFGRTIAFFSKFVNTRGPCATSITLEKVSILSRVHVHVVTGFFKVALFSTCSVKQLF